MNKATIYIDPKDDITDILSDLKKVKNKIVALVPPKKTDVLHSSVNIKLIQKTATDLGKVVVLVTSDPVILKLAKTSKIPVAENLQSRPEIPETEKSLSAESSSATSVKKLDNSEEKTEEKTEKTAKTDEEITEDFTSDNKPVDEIIESIEADKETEERETEEEDKTEPDDTEKESKKDKKSKKKKEKDPFKSNKKKWIIFGSVIGVAVILFFVWALIIAPAVTIAVSIKTTSGNFSENVSFTKDESQESVESGTFYIREEKITKEATVKFTATGKKDLGEKASGTLLVSYRSTSKYNQPVPVGTIFTHNGLEYVSTTGATLAWDGKFKNCPDEDADSESGCLTYAEIKVEAAAPGENYNISALSHDWSNSESSTISVSNNSEISGGTSNIVTIVQQSDVDSALDKLSKENSATGKAEILAKLSETTFPIETSFKVETSDPVSTPAVGEEVKDGVTPTLSSATSYTMFTLDSVRIEEYIKQKANISDDREIYSIGSPFLEYFIESDSGYSAKLKTTYRVGPKVTETDILEKSRGKKIGEVQSLLKSINGVNTVNIKKSVFWVNSIPNDVNKITVEVDIEE